MDGLVIDENLWIDMGLQRFHRNLQPLIAASLFKQYQEKKENEGKYVKTTFEIYGLQLFINYDTQYMVSFNVFYLVSQMKSIEAI